MKRFAYLHQDGNYIKTNVWEERRQKKENPREFEERTYVSTHKKIENRIPLFFVDRKPNAYFRYPSGSSREDYIGQGESLTHELCKEAISELKTLKFISGKNEFIIYVDEVEIEQKVEINGNRYYTDIFIWFNKSKPSYLVNKWGGKLAIEIYVTHETPEKKMRDFLNEGIPIIEIKISEKFRVDESRQMSSQEILRIKNTITQYYEEKIFGKILSNPESEEYKKMVEISQLKKTIEKLEEKNSLLENEIKKKNLYVQELQTENNTLKSQIENLYTDNRNLKINLETLKIENEKLKDPLLKKIFNKFFNQ